MSLPAGRKDSRLKREANYWLRFSGYRRSLSIAEFKPVWAIYSQLSSQGQNRKLPLGPQAHI